MIDWFNLFANALWIIALAVAVATLSYASWEASMLHEKMRLRLRQAKYQIALDVAGVLFCAGLATTSNRAWEIVLWAILGVLFAVQAGVEIVKRQ